jgi:hypothetical protein
VRSHRLRPTIDRNRAGTEWFLRKHEDGTIFGLLSFELFSRWASAGQIAPLRLLRENAKDYAALAVLLHFLRHTNSEQVETAMQRLRCQFAKCKARYSGRFISPKYRASFVKGVKAIRQLE